jgi:hypothetical protein
VVFVFLEISNGIEPAIFTVDKLYGLASYLIDSDSNPLMSDDNLYKVSCFIKPDNADTQHPSQSAMSNAVDARPSNLPSAPTISIVSGSNPPVAAGNAPPSVGTYPVWAAGPPGYAPQTIVSWNGQTYRFKGQDFGNSGSDPSVDTMRWEAYTPVPAQYQDWSVSWTAPADISYWNRFNNSKVQVQIFIRKVNSFSDTPDVTLDNPQTLKYTFTGIDTFNNGVSTTLAGQGIAMKIRYVNDSGAGAFSDVVYYYNYQNVSAVTNLSAAIDYQNQVVNVSWDAPANLAISSAPYQYELVQTKAGVSTTVRDTFQNSIRYGFPYLASDVGASLSYSVVLKSRWVNDASVVLTSPAATTGQVSLFTKPTPLSNCNASGGDKQINFTWSAPTVLDGLNHSANEAVIVVTQIDTGFTLTINGSAGYCNLAGLTNGLVYSADFYSVGTTPSGAKLTSETAFNVANIIPKGGYSFPTNVKAEAGDKKVTISWNEAVGDVVNGHTISGFRVAINGGGRGFIYAGYETTSNSLTLEAPAGYPPFENGVQYELWVSNIFGGRNFGDYVKNIYFTPFGKPEVSNVQLSGKTVTCDFKPNGRVFSGFDVIGLTAVPNITDQILLQTPADMSAYPRDISGTVSLSFTFTSISANLAAAILVLATSAGTVVGSSGLTFNA